MNWLQFLANGVVVGSIVLLGAVGLSLLFGVKRFANFAHGDLMTLGAYLAFTAAVSWGFGLAVGVVVGVVGVALLGVGLEWSLFDRLRARPPAVMLIVTVALSFVLQNLVRIVWGTRDLSFPLNVETSLDLGFGVFITPLKLLVVATAAAAAVGLHLLLTRTLLGKALRATSDNYDLARVTGIPVKRVEHVAWALGGGLAALGGIGLAAVTLLNPNLGFAQLLLLFAAVILGGIGSPYGAMLGAFLIGIALEVSKPVLELAGQSSTLSPAVAFLVLVVVLVAKPEGLVGRPVRGARRTALRKVLSRRGREVAPPG